MPPSTPFVDQGTGTIDATQILVEAIPLAKLIGVFVVISLVPLTMAFLLGNNALAGVVFSLVGQFILAVGAGIVLMYTISRAIQLSTE